MWVPAHCALVAFVIPDSVSTSHVSMGEPSGGRPRPALTARMPVMRWLVAIIGAPLGLLPPVVFWLTVGTGGVVCWVWSVGLLLWCLVLVNALGWLVCSPAVLRC